MNLPKWTVFHMFVIFNYFDFKEWIGYFSKHNWVFPMWCVQNFLLKRSFPERHWVRQTKLGGYGYGLRSGDKTVPKGNKIKHVDCSCLRLEEGRGDYLGAGTSGPGDAGLTEAGVHHTLRDELQGCSETEFSFNIN